VFIFCLKVNCSPFKVYCIPCGIKYVLFFLFRKGIVNTLGILAKTDNCSCDIKYLTAKMDFKVEIKNS